jgi:hypothetical protein
VPWTVVASFVADRTPLAFHTIIKLPVVLADCALAWVLFRSLSARGFPRSRCMLAACLVALGPPLILISGFHGQNDALSVLPAVVAIALWPTWRAQRWGPAAAGALVALGTAIKPAPALMIIPLLLAASSRRHRVQLLMGFVVPLATLTAPFFVADPKGLTAIRDYRGFPGLGGLSLLVQPSLVLGRRIGEPVEFSDLQRFLISHGKWVTAGVLLLAIAWALRTRPSVTDAAAFIALAGFVGFPFYARSYLCWLLPILILSGRLGLSALLQGLGFAAFLAGELTFGHHLTAYVVLLDALTVVAAGGLIRMGFGLREARPSGRRGAQPAVGPGTNR